MLEADNNRLGSKTASALGRALARNRALQRLSLAGCRLTGEDAAKLDVSGVAALAGALGGANRTLLALNLFGVGLGVDGGRALAAGLATSTGLTSLALDPTDGVAPADVAAIYERLAANAAAARAAAADAKAAKLEARRVALAAEAEAKAKAAAEAEAAWAEGEAAFRAEQRAAARDAEATAEIKAVLDRAKAEKDRKERLKAEAEEKAKAAKAKAKKG